MARPGAPNAAPPPFASSAAQRAALDAALERGVLALVDIGTAKATCLICRIDRNQIGEGAAGLGGFGAARIVGAGVNRARGVRLGAVVDMEEAERAVRAAVDQAQRDSGEKATHAVVTLSAGYPRSHALTGETAVEKESVSERDLSRAVAACRPPSEGDGREILHAIPVNWSLDAEPRVRDPRGFAGRRLGVDLHVLTVAEGAVRNLALVLRRADLALAGAAATGYASGLACLAEEELEDGAACIDLGAGATTIALFLRRHLVFADALRFGGEHITQDVMRAFGLAFPDAERLKVLEGAAVVGEGAGRQRIEAAFDLGRFNGQPPTRADLATAIRPRFEETLVLARDRLEQAGFAFLPSRRVVLTGGGAQLKGAVEAARAVFGSQVRIGRPLRIGGLPPQFSGPAFAAVAGLATYAVRAPDAVWSAPRDGAKGGAAAPRWGGLFRWLKDTW
ncbi:MAG: cell division protein FtsA [Pseudomonadota bacterium]